MTRILITGMGMVSPFGVGTADFMNGLLSGRPSTRKITRFPVDHLPSRLCAEVDRSILNRQLKGAAARRLDTASRMILVAARDALTGRNEPLSPERTGIILGTRAAGLDVSIDFLTAIRDHGMAYGSPMRFMNTVLNAAASHLAIDAKIKGPNLTLTRGITSGSVALHAACRLLETGRADCVLAGAVELFDPVTFTIATHLKEFSRAGTYPEGSRPFSPTANGAVAGEGAVILVLETAENVRKKNREWIAGIDGYSAGEPEAVLNRACENTAGGSRAIGAVLSGADGSPETDSREAAALTERFAGPDSPPVTAIRGALGSGCASVCFQAAAACRILHGDQLPGTRGDNQWITDKLSFSSRPRNVPPGTTILVTDLDDTHYHAFTVHGSNGHRN